MASGDRSGGKKGGGKPAQFGGGKAPQRGRGGPGGQRGGQGSGGAAGGRGAGGRGRRDHPGRAAGQGHRRGPGKRGEDQLEGRNIVGEALRRRRRTVRLIHLDDRARDDDKVADILALAAELDVRVVRVPRDDLDALSETGVHNGVIAWAQPLVVPTLSQLLDDLFERGELPFIALVDEVNYEHNLGAILRSALGAGVHAVVVPVVRGKGLTAVVHRVAMGGAEEVPVIREGLSSALATLRRAGVQIVGANMGGVPAWELNLRGALAVVLGGEHKGLSPTLAKRCNAIASVPLAGDLDSLNVSVTAGILFFEKVRQDALG